MDHRWKMNTDDEMVLVLEKFLMTVDRIERDRTHFGTGGRGANKEQDEAYNHGAALENLAEPPTTRGSKRAEVHELARWKAGR